jgi:hypothetical protein
LLLTEPLFCGWHYKGNYACNMQGTVRMKNFCQSLIDPEMILHHNHDRAEKISIEV